MNNSNKVLLLIAGIFSVIFGVFELVFFTGVSFYVIGVGIILIILSSKSEEELYSEKGLLLALGIILIFLNFISAILTFVVVSQLKKSKEKSPIKINSPNKTKNNEIKNQKVKKKQIDPEIRKIDILLKLGIFMVLVSGILFATTTWEYINNLIKVGFLLFLSAMFFFLSRFSDKKLKLENTTFAYFILGIAFLNFTWVSICYFKIISPFLSFTGPGKNLSISITFLLLGLSSYLTEIKYPKNYITYFKYLCFYLAFYFLMLFMDLDFLLIISIITFITFIFNILLKDSDTLFKKFTENISYILWIPLLYEIFYINPILYFIGNTIRNLENTSMFYPLASILNIINLIYLSFDKDNDINSYLVPIASNLLVLNIIFNNLYFQINESLLIVITLSIMFVIIKLLKNKLSKLLINVNKVLYSIIVIPIIFYNIGSNYFIALIISTIYLLVNLINTIDNEDSNKGLESALVPISIFLAIKSLEIYLVNDLYINLGNSFTYILTSIIFFIIHITSNNENKSNTYLYALLILSAMRFVINIFDVDILVSLSTLIVFTYFYYKYDKDNNDSAIVFVAILYNIFQLLTQTNIFANYNVLSNILTIIIYLIIIYYKRENKLLKGLTSLVIILPIYNLIKETEMFPVLHLISINVLELYILMLLVTYLAKDNEGKNLLATCGIIVIMLQVIFYNSIFTALYVGVFGVLLAIYGFYKKEYPYLFGLGIVITIVNIIYELRGVWTRIPFWLYLLVFGLSIIAFVMNREIKKLDSKNNKKKK